jgi:hypothetical protein
MGFFTLCWGVGSIAGPVSRGAATAPASAPLAPPLRASCCQRSTALTVPACPVCLCQALGGALSQPCSVLPSLPGCEPGGLLQIR